MLQNMSGLHDTDSQFYSHNHLVKSEYSCNEVQTAVYSFSSLNNSPTVGNHWQLSHNSYRSAYWSTNMSQNYFHRQFCFKWPLRGTRETMAEDKGQMHLTIHKLTKYINQVNKTELTIITTFLRDGVNIKWCVSKYQWLLWKQHFRSILWTAWNKRIKAGTIE